MAAGEILCRPRRAAIGNMLQIGFGLQLEQFHRKMMRRANSRRSVVELARSLLHIGDEFFRRLDRERRMHGQRQRAGGDQHDWIEARHRIVRQGLEQAGIVRERTGRHQNRMAVGCRTRGHLRSDIAAGAGLVVDDHRLAPARLDLFPDEPRKNVRAAAGRKRDHDGDGAARLLRGRGCRQCDKHRSANSH